MATTIMASLNVVASDSFDSLFVDAKYDVGDTNGYSVGLGYQFDDNFSILLDHTQYDDIENENRLSNDTYSSVNALINSGYLLDVWQVGLGVGIGYTGQFDSYPEIGIDNKNYEIDANIKAYINYRLTKNIDFTADIRKIFNNRDNLDSVNLGFKVYWGRSFPELNIINDDSLEPSFRNYLDDSVGALIESEELLRKYNVTTEDSSIHTNQNDEFLINKIDITYMDTTISVDVNKDVIIFENIFPKGKYDITFKVVYKSSDGEEKFELVQKNVTLYNPQALNFRVELESMLIGDKVNVDVL
ncbi:hypothetical protein ACNZ70_001708 [Vibrio mimicus]